MSNRISGHDDDVVERAAAAIRAQTPPAGPSEELLNRTIARVGAGKISKVSEGKGWWNMRVVRRSALAAGLAIVATAGILLLHSRQAFADVVEQVKAAKAVRCRMSVEVEVDGVKQTSESDTLMVSSGWTIVTSPGMKMIISTEKGRMLMLMPAQKTATVVEMKNMPANSPRAVNILDTFKNVDGKEGRPLGAKEIDGKSARGFEVDNGGMQMKVWADTKTSLPVLVEMAPNSPIMPAGAYTMKDFDWNPNYDPSELSVDVPEGYHSSNFAIDTTHTTEADAVAMLKAMAETGGGQFPEGVGLAEYTKALAANIAARTQPDIAAMTPEQRAQWQQKTMDEMMQAMAPISRGWAFIGDATKGENWQYAGSGVKPGDKDRPILWYQAKPSGAWRVINADFTVHESKESDLPKGTPVKLNLGFGAVPATQTAPTKVLP